MHVLLPAAEQHLSRASQFLRSGRFTEGESADCITLLCTRAPALSSRKKSWQVLLQITGRCVTWARETACRQLPLSIHLPAKPGRVHKTATLPESTFVSCRFDTTSGNMGSTAVPWRRHSRAASGDSAHESPQVLRAAAGHLIQFAGMKTFVLSLASHALWIQHAVPGVRTVVRQSSLQGGVW